MPSKVTLYSPSWKPRRLIFWSARPGPLVDGIEATLGAMAVMVLKLPVGGVESSMKAREMIDCGWVAFRLACVGATEAAVPRSAFTVGVAAAPPGRSGPATAGVSRYVLGRDRRGTCYGFFCEGWETRSSRGEPGKSRDDG